MAVSPPAVRRLVRGSWSGGWMAGRDGGAGAVTGSGLVRPLLGAVRTSR